MKRETLVGFFLGILQFLDYFVVFHEFLEWLCFFFVYVCFGLLVGIFD